MCQLTFPVHDKLLLESAVLGSLPLLPSLPRPAEAATWSHHWHQAFESGPFLSHHCLEPLCSICHLCPLPLSPGTLFSWCPPPPPQYSLWNASQMLSSPGIALAITYWWAPLWTSTLGCHASVSDSACPRGPQPFILGCSALTHGPSLKTCWPHLPKLFILLYLSDPYPSPLDNPSDLPTGLLLTTLSSAVCMAQYMTLYCCLKPLKDCYIMIQAVVTQQYGLSKLIELYKGWILLCEFYLNKPN